MANTRPKTLTSNINIALSPKDRKLIRRAATVLEQFPSVWARAVLLREANQIIGEAVAACPKQK